MKGLRKMTPGQLERVKNWAEYEIRRDGPVFYDLLLRGADWTHPVVLAIHNATLGSFIRLAYQDAVEKDPKAARALSLEELTRLGSEYRTAECHRLGIVQEAVKRFRAEGGHKDIKERREQMAREQAIASAANVIPFPRRAPASALTA